MAPDWKDQEPPRKWIGRKAIELTGKIASLLAKFAKIYEASKQNHPNV
jgi:hypothetical protein